MKSMLLIGLGDFGHHLCRQLVHMQNEVLAVDKNEDALDDLDDMVSGKIIADCTSKSALESLGIDNFDMCFVCIGSDFRSNLIIVSTLKELGASYIISETNDEMLGKLLLQNGANEVIHPNRDSAIRSAVKYSSEHIFDYIHLSDGYAIYEITPLKEWVGKSIRDSKIREKYDTYIVGIRGSAGSTNIMPSPDTTITEHEKLLVLCHETTMAILLKKMES